MSDTTAYVAFENIVLTLYDEGHLNPTVLTAIGCEFGCFDMDSGDSYVPYTNDGKELSQVCVETLNPSFVPECNEEDIRLYGPDCIATKWYQEFKRIAKDQWGWTGSI